MATASPFTQGNNFVSALQGSVDPRTGMFSFNFQLAQLCAVNTLGPKLPLSLRYSPMTQGDPFGLGKGISFGFSVYDDRASKSLQLSTGEQFKTEYTASGDLIIRQHKLDTVHLNVVKKGDQKEIIVTHKTGDRETLSMVGGAGIYFPTRLENALGYALALNWDTTFRLASIRDVSADQTLCTLSYHIPGEVNIKLWPATPEATQINLTQYGGYLTTVTHPCESGDLIWTIAYDTAPSRQFNDTHPLCQVSSPTGMTERVLYEKGIIRFTTTRGEGAFPAVVRHTVSPGAGQPDVVRTFSYTASNYLGFGAQILNPDDNDDNLYNVLSRYEYGSVETLRGSPASGISDRITSRQYNNFHLLISEQEQTRGTLLTILRKTDYFAIPGRAFIAQPATFQMPKSQQVIWSDGVNTPREEITSLSYDEKGNLISQKAPDGTVTDYEYYPAAGEGDDCPAEPNGFMRFPKSKTVSPAQGVYDDVPVSRTEWRYSALPALYGSSFTTAVLLRDISHKSDGSTLNSESYQYIDAPTSREHGRIKSKTTRIWSGGQARYSATQTFMFDTQVASQVLQKVTTSCEEHPGQSGTRTLTLTSTRAQSALSGLLLNETDIAGNTVSYQYDRLGRLISKTYQPEKMAYRTQEGFSYALPDKSKALPAQTLHSDIHGNQVRTRHDGLGRVIQEDVKLHGQTIGWKTVGSHTFDVQGRKNYSQRQDTMTDANPIIKTLTRTWDGWGLLSEECAKEVGLRGCQFTDPVGRVWPDKKELGRLTTTESWTVASRDGQVSPKIRVYHDRFQRPVVTERWAVAADGVSWETEAYSVSRQIWDTAHRLRENIDPLGRRTTFKYDSVGRTVETTYADNTVVKKGYAAFSHTALPIWISLTDQNKKETFLGQQEFDGLGRLIKTTSGGRITTMNYEAAWQRSPTKVTKSDGSAHVLSADPALGEAPLSVIATGNAENVSQSFTYNLPTGELKTAIENNTRLNLERWPSGRLKTESTAIAAGTEQHAQWDYSLCGLPQTYTGVGGQKEIREWSAKGQLVSITDPAVKVSLSYDTLGRMLFWEVVTRATQEKLTTSLSYDGRGNEASRTLTYADKTGKTILTQRIGQEWSITGQLIRRILKNDDHIVRDETFCYGARNRLTQYNCGGTRLPQDPYNNEFTQQKFQFDALGNLLFCQTTLACGVTDNAHSFFENPDDPCQLTRVTHSLRGRQYHYPEEIKLEYDKAGRMIRDEAGRTLRYDAMGRLNAVKGKGRYGYDAKNRMVYQKVDKENQAHRLYYRANRLIEEWMTKGDGKTPHPEDKQVRLVYAASGCAAQETSRSGQVSTMLTGTDGKQSVVARAQNGEVKTTTYTPYGYSPPEEDAGVRLGPDDVSNALDFKLEFPDSTVSGKALIYSNGQNQVAITIRAELCNAAQEAVNLTPTEMWNALTLKIMRGDEIIAKQSPLSDYKAPSVWNTAGDYAHAVRYEQSVASAITSKDASSSVQVYVATAEPEGAYEIYAELDFKHFRLTSKDSLPPNIKSHLRIDTLKPINYDDEGNWSVKSDGWHVVGRPAIESRQKAFPGWTDGGTVTSQYRIFKVVNANAGQGSPVRFVKREVEGKTFYRTDAAGDYKGLLSASYGWGRNTNQYHVNAFWVEPALTPWVGPLVGYWDLTYNYCLLEAYNHYYRICLNGEGINRVVDVLDENAIALYEWSLIYENDDVYPQQWSDMAYDATVSVTDNFGNTGKVAFHFSTYVDDPEIIFGSDKRRRILTVAQRDTLREKIAHLPESERTAALESAGAYHLSTGSMRARPADNDITRNIRLRFSNQAIPSDKDLEALIDLCALPGQVIPVTEAVSGGLGLNVQKNTLCIKGAAGFSIEGGTLVFDVATYLAGRKHLT